MKILNNNIESKIDSNIIPALLHHDYDLAVKNITEILGCLYNSMPEKNRISYGRVFTIKVLSEYLYNQLRQNGARVFQIASTLFTTSEDFKNKGIALGILSHYGLDDFHKVLPYFESAAASAHWDVREFAQMSFRKLLQQYPDEAKKILLRCQKSNNANIRRFVSETLRPVRENRSFIKNPDYPLSILKNMFTENSPYPRTSVDNNLSDLARNHPGLVYELVEKLVVSGNKHSYWIAYRACRNLVKKEPIKVMNLLKIEEYKYKKSDYQGN